MRQAILVAAIGALALLAQPGSAYADPGITALSPAGAIAAAIQVPAGDIVSASLGTSDPKVMFIQGIGSISACPNSDNAGESIPKEEDFVKRLSWLASALAQRVDELESDDFLYYAYRSPYTENPLCADGETPDYSKRDSCWSLDDVFKQFFIQREVPGGGQARRLASFLRNYLDNNPGTELSIVAHSQGGVLATYTVKEKLSQPYRDRIEAIVTYDSPLRGINRLGPGVLRVFSGCANLDLKLDSSFDMTPGSAVIARINDDTETPSTKLYTIDANPGCQPLSSKLCTGFPLIDDYHSDAPWSLGKHLRVRVETHGDIWDGRFLKNGEVVPADETGRLPAEGLRLVRFTACAVANLPGSCIAFANQPD